MQERLKLVNEEFDSVNQKLNLGSAGVAMAQVLFDPDQGGGHKLFLMNHPGTAQALGIEPARVFKTLLVELAGSGDLAVGIVPVDLQLDLKAIASAAGVKKCRMADPAMAERVTGYIVGGISPLGQKKLLRTFLDSSAAGFDTINVSAGRRGLEIELAAKDLLALTRGRLADIARR